MQGQFCLIVNKNFQRLYEENVIDKMSNAEYNLTHICHEFLASCSDILRQSCTEHHDLLVVRCCSENFLHVAAHVY
jgi:hypothetical protein